MERRERRHVSRTAGGKDKLVPACRPSAIWAVSVHLDSNSQTAASCALTLLASRFHALVITPERAPVEIDDGRSGWFVPESVSLIPDLVVNSTTITVLNTSIPNIHGTPSASAGAAEEKASMAAMHVLSRGLWQSLDFLLAAFADLHFIRSDDSMFDAYTQSAATMNASLSAMQVSIRVHT